MCVCVGVGGWVMVVVVVVVGALGSERTRREGTGCGQLQASLVSLWEARLGGEGGPLRGEGGQR